MKYMQVPSHFHGHIKLQTRKRWLELLGLYVETHKMIWPYVRNAIGCFHCVILVPRSQQFPRDLGYVWLVTHSLLLVDLLEDLMCFRCEMMILL